MSPHATGRLPGRIWFEVAVATLSSILCALSLAWPEWIETFFHVSPDEHSGSLEWEIALALLTIACVFAGLATLDYRRYARQSKQGSEAGGG